jgi:tetratricopeptide (TPR) repeat protein
MISRYSNNLASLLSDNLGRPDEALPIAQQARKTAPNNGAIADTLGWIFVQKGEFQKALPLFREAVSANTNASEVRYTWG